jgi:hypothetical protein
MGVVLNPPKIKREFYVEVQSIYKEGAGFSEHTKVRSPGCIPKRVQNQTKIRLVRTAFCIDSQ